jgi:hypothetical protein
MIRRCPKYKEPYLKDPKAIRTAGVDVGVNTFDIRISDQVNGKKYFVASGTLPYPAENVEHGDIAWCDLGNILFEDFECDLVVVDHMPKVEEARKFSIKYAGKVYRAFFHHNFTSPVWKNATEKDKNKKFMVYMDRTTLLDNVQFMVSTGKLIYHEKFFKCFGKSYNGITQNFIRYKKHLMALHRQNLADTKKEANTIISTDIKPAWVQKSNEPDHQFLAEAYDTLAGMMVHKEPKLIKPKIYKYKNEEDGFLNIDKMKRQLAALRGDNDDNRDA